MIDKTEEAEDPWYKEESDYMQVYNLNQLNYIFLVLLGDKITVDD